MGRIVGQILLYLYLSPSEASLDEIGKELGLSKASVSIAARQLESFGLLRRVWKRGDRKNYYRTVDNIVLALRQGLIAFFRQKVVSFGTELDYTLASLSEEKDSENNNIESELEFLMQRVSRARQLQKRLESVIENPLVKFLAKDK